MRVFVIGTGRCGSVSFCEACKFISNYTTSHERRSFDLEYPDNHVEVNCHLSTAIIRLNRKYPGSFWVHLIRDKLTCVPALASLDGGDVMKCYRRLYPSIIPDNPVAAATRFYDDRVNQIRSQFSYANLYGFEVKLETVKADWGLFWQLIDAKGDFQKSLAAWEVKRNTTEQRQ